MLRLQYATLPCVCRPNTIRAQVGDGPATGHVDMTYITVLRRCLPQEDNQDNPESVTTIPRPVILHYYTTRSLTRLQHLQLPRGRDPPYNLTYVLLVSDKLPAVSCRTLYIKYLHLRVGHSQPMTLMPNAALPKTGPSREHTHTHIQKPDRSAVT